MNKGDYNPKNPDTFKQEELPPEEPLKLNIEQLTPGESVLTKGDFISPNYRKGESGFRISSDGSIEANNLSLYSNNPDAIIIDHGGNILFKEGGNIKFTSVANPTACVATLVATGTGNIDNGTHKYRITFVNAAGETSLGSVSNTITVDASNKQVTLSSIPVSTSGGVTSRKIYRTKAGGSDYFLLDTIYNNTSTSYTDNTADASLVGSFNAGTKQNSSFGKIFADGGIVFSAGLTNTFVGRSAGFYNVIGSQNTALGSRAFQCDSSSLQNATYNNVAIGTDSMIVNYSGNNNTALGASSLLSNTTGNNKVGIGFSALYHNLTGSGNVALGYYAGYYSTESDTFYLNNRDRTNSAGDIAKSLLYGIFADAVNNQALHVNGVFFPLSSTTAAAPSYVEGAIYYDTTLHKLRVGGAAAWETITSV